MEPREEQEEFPVLDLKRQLEDEDLKVEQKFILLNDGLTSETSHPSHTHTLSVSFLAVKQVFSLFMNVTTISNV